MYFDIETIRVLKSYLANVRIRDGYSSLKQVEYEYEYFFEIKKRLRIRIRILRQTFDRIQIFIRIYSLFDLSIRIRFNILIRLKLFGKIRILRATNIIFYDYFTLNLKIDKNSVETFA